MYHQNFALNYIGESQINKESLYDWHVLPRTLSSEISTLMVASSLDAVPL
jgi:hypothetical protein